MKKKKFHGILYFYLFLKRFWPNSFWLFKASFDLIFFTYFVIFFKRFLYILFDFPRHYCDTRRLLFVFSLVYNRCAAFQPMKKDRRRAGTFLCSFYSYLSFLFLGCSLCYTEKLTTQVKLIVFSLLLIFNCLLHYSFISATAKKGYAWTITHTHTVNYLVSTSAG